MAKRKGSSPAVNFRRRRLLIPGGSGGQTASLDFTRSAEPNFAVQYDTGETYKFSRASTRWVQGYDTSSGGYVWQEIGQDIVPIKGFYYANPLTEQGSPRDANGDLIPGSFRLGYHYGPQQTNSIADSRTFDSGSTSWLNQNSVSINKNAVGFDGTSNSATTINDTDNTAFGFAAYDITVSNDGATHTSVGRVKKDSASGSNLPSFRLLLMGGTTTLQEEIQIDPSDGSTSELFSDGTSEVFEDGDFYVIVLTLTNNSTGNTTIRTSLIPARGDTLGASDSTVQGSAVYDQIETRLNTSFYDRIPITTDGSAATRLRDDYTISLNNHNQSAGMVLTELLAEHDETDVLGGTNGIVSVRDNTLSVLLHGANNFLSDDGTKLSFTANPAYEVGDTVFAASRWSGAGKAVVVDGTEGTSTYDGEYTLGTDVNLLYSSSHPWIMKSLQYYKVDKGADWIVSRQS